jgi:peroxiredoxin
MKSVTKSKTIVLLLTVLTLSCPFTAAASNDTLLNMIPSDSLFCLRVNQFNTSLGKFDQYLMGASPMPLSMAMLINFQFAAIVGDPTLAGIDQNGTFMAVGVPWEEDSIDMTLIVPMTDYEAFIKNNAACSSSGTPGVTLLSAPNSPVGTLAMMPAPGGKYAFVNSEDKMDALTAFQIKMTAQASKLAATLDDEQSSQAASSPIWIYVNLAKLFEMYGPALVEGLASAMEEMPQEIGMAAVMEMYMQMLNAMVKDGFSQADALTLALTPDPAVLNLDFAFKAKNGSTLAGIFVADPQAADGFSMAGYSDDAAAFNGVFKTNRPMFEKLTAVFIDFMKNSFSDKFAAEDIDRITTLTEKSLKASGKETFISFSYGSGQPPFALRQVQQINDPAFYKTAMQDGIAVANSMYKAMDLPFVFSYKPGVETYKNISFDAFVISFESQEDDQMAEVIKQVYGPEGLTYYAAQTDKLMFTTFGPNSKNDLKALIDAPVNRAASGELQKAMAILGPTAQRADLVGSVNIIKLIKGGLEMVQQTGVPVEALSAISQALDIQTQSCMAVSTTIANGKVASRLALPKQHLMEIVTVAMQIQNQMMQAQTQGGMMGETAQTAPATPFAPQPAQSPAARKDPLQEWIGKPSPDIKLTDLQGNKFSITDLKGKKVIIDFWATWCPPCKDMIPGLIKLRESGSAAQWVLLGVSNEPADRLSKFAAEYKMNYPVISYTGAMPDPYSKVTGLPTTFFIDSLGVIRHVLVGFHEMSDIQAALDSMQ